MSSAGVKHKAASMQCTHYALRHAAVATILASVWLHGLSLYALLDNVKARLNARHKSKMRMMSM